MTFRRLCFLAVLVTSVLFPDTSEAIAQTTARISGASTFAVAKQYLDVAPKRWVGSPGHAKAVDFIKSHFKPEADKGDFDIDSFSASTPAGLLPMQNLIVRYPGKKDGVIVIGSHYETNYPLRDLNFVGANDGAATTALLIELGAYLRAHPPMGYSVWLVFFDGEEAIQSWSAADSLYGSRHLAAKWSSNGTLPKIKALLLADMVGDKDLNIDRDANSTPWLLDLLSVAAKNTGHSGSIFKNATQVEDDHIPFVKRGVPSLDIIDLDYGPPTAEHPEGGFHHTEMDTLDKVSPRSLQTSSDLFLALLPLIDQHH